MKTIKLLFVLCAMSLSAAHAGNLSFVQKDTVKTEKNEAVAQKKETTKKDSVDKKKETEYDKLIKKGGSVNEGVFTVRHIEDKWYLEVPEDKLGRLFQAVTRLTAVPQGAPKFTGEMVKNATFYFEKRDDKTMLMRLYKLRAAVDSNDRIAQTVKTSTVDPITQVFKIIGKNKDTGRMLIDVTTFLKRDNDVIGKGDAFIKFPETLLKKYEPGAYDDGRSFVDTVKVFPTNIEAMTTKTYGTATFGFNTSIVLLPEKPMRPRFFDERVGYFSDFEYAYFSDDQQKVTHENMIARFRLEPKDEKAYKAGKLVEPKKPIVFYIDPATPKQWVKYLMLGINDWNVAFEAAGFKNAIIGKECPADGSISPDDARYNFIRYLPSEEQNAYGPHISDPRSGETIESHVCWYHNVMQLVRNWYMIQCGVLDKRAQNLRFDEDLMGQLIRFVSSHEVGHTLGLRHNMIASSATPVEKLRDKAWVEKNGHTASIMDYARFNYVAQPEDKIGEKGLFPRINDYDKWAIKWGYQWRPEFKDEHAEKIALRKEVTKVLTENPRMKWSGDEDANNDDPRSQSEDLGDNSMKASDYGVKNLKRVMQHIEQWTAQTDGQYDELKTVWGNVVSQFGRYTTHVTRNIAGRLKNNITHLPQYDYVDKAKEKEAIDWLFANRIQNMPTWLYPESINAKLGTNAQVEMANAAVNVINNLLSQDMLKKHISNAQFSSKVLTIEEYLDYLYDKMWKNPLPGNEMTRKMERAYLMALDKILNPTEEKKQMNVGGANLTVIVGKENNDVPLYAMQHLLKIEKNIQQRASTSSSIDQLHAENLLLILKKIKGVYNKTE